MKAAVYVENSVVSYLTARPNKGNPRVAVHQELTREAVCRANGYEPPVLCTPEELMEP